MAQLGPYEGQFKAAGAELVLVAAEKRRGMFKPEDYLMSHPTPYPFLLDEDRKVTRMYGVYHRAGTDAINIARPATFVITEGVVRYIFVGSSQTDRSPVDEILRALPPKR